MTSEEDALAAVLARVSPLPARKASLLDSLGHFSAQDAFASRPLPAFDNSAMDGYAVQAQSCRAGAKLHLIGEQPAGPDRCLTIGPGEAIRIFTGAPLPAGADAILMQEDATWDGETVVAQCGVEPGEFVRRKGSDLAAGQKILTRGDRLAAQTLALLASQGLAEIEIGAMPRVAIVATGDEFAQAGENPGPGQIFESNSLMLHALALGSGAEVRMVERAPDILDRLLEILRRGLRGDVLIVSGGVSVGDRDLVKPALRALGAEIDLWRVALKPGKPFLFGRAEACCIFGLPGNPVSAFVTFLKFVRPALRKMAGAREEDFGLPRVTARLGGDAENEGDRPHYLRGTLRDGVFNLIGRQESHALFGLSRANALLRLEPWEKKAKGAPVTVEIWE
jgi:molybdopterin molybdotransferase